MNEACSLESIKRHARIAAEDQEDFGTKAVNPCELGTDAHKSWAAEFYEHKIAIGSEELA